MFKSKYLYPVVGGLFMLLMSPAHAWWGNNWAQQGDGNYYGRNYPAPGGYYQYPDYEQERYRDDWWHGPWNGGTWEDWRAPWSNDDSRWGSGPWDGFGEAMNNFIGEMETDLDLNLKLKAENEAKTKARGETREEFRGYRDRRTYSYPYYNPYYGYGYGATQYPSYPYYAQPQPGPSTVQPNQSGQKQQ